MNKETAILAGGCFWGMEELVKKIPGVNDTQVGNIGGKNDHPTYKNHPGHAEALKIEFDPSKVTYKEILDFFFRVHDPTTMNQQGNDVGTSYRSAIFYQNDEQKKVAQEMIKIVNDSKRWKNPVVTEITKAAQFWPAEEYHQDYLIKNPGGYTCHYVRFDSYLK